VSEVISGQVTYGATYGGGGKGIIDSQSEVGGWPELLSYDQLDDTDKDGMPDNWETSKGLNPEDPEDRNLIADGEIYTNLELYLNEKAIREDYLFRPVYLTATYLDIPAVELNWTDLSNNETSFTIERSESSGFKEIGTVGPGITTFTDNEIENHLSYTYRVYAFNDQLVSLYSDTVSISIATDIQSYELVLGVSGFPNPVQDIYSIRVNSKVTDKIGVEIYSINGAMTESATQFNIISGSNTLELDMGNYHSGIYIIRVFHEDGSQKFLKVIKR